MDSILFPIHPEHCKRIIDGVKERCEGVCALYMSEQDYKAFMAQVLAEAKENKG